MMAELGSNCFWHPKIDYFTGWKLELPINIEDLPLSWELNNQLTEWVECFETDIFTKKFYKLAINNFDILGKQLWQLVKEELASEYKVVYYSELEKKVLDD